MGARGPTLELRMELCTYKPGVIGHFDNLDQAVICRASTDNHASIFQPPPIHIIEFIAMPMALKDNRLAICLLRLAAGGQTAYPIAQAHGAALIRDLALVGHEID